MLNFSKAWPATVTASCCMSSLISAFLITALRSVISDALFAGIRHYTKKAGTTQNVHNPKETKSKWRACARKRVWPSVVVCPYTTCGVSVPQRIGRCDWVNVGTSLARGKSTGYWHDFGQACLPVLVRHDGSVRARVLPCLCLLASMARLRLSKRIVQCWMLIDWLCILPLSKVGECGN